MDEYCITMECTYRRAVWFSADNDDEAEKKAEEIYMDARREDFTADDDCEWDYALVDPDGVDIVSWS